MINENGKRRQNRSLTPWHIIVPKGIHGKFKSISFQKFGRDTAITSGEDAFNDMAKGEIVTFLVASRMKIAEEGSVHPQRMSDLLFQSFANGVNERKRTRHGFHCGSIVIMESISRKEGLRI